MLFKHNFFYFFLKNNPCMCLCQCIFTCGCGCPQRSEEGIGFLGTGATGHCEVLNMAAMIKTQVLLAEEQVLQLIKNIPSKMSSCMFVALEFFFWGGGGMLSLFIV